MGKRHDNVKRDIKAVRPQLEGILSLRTGRSIIVYELSSTQMGELKYGDHLLDKMKIRDYEKRIPLLEDENKALKERNDNLEQDKTNLEQDKTNLQDTIMKMKREKELSAVQSRVRYKDLNKKYLKYHAKSVASTTIIKFLKKQVKNLQQNQNPDVMRLFAKSIGINETSSLPDMSKQDIRRGMQAFHPDKTKEGSNQMFMFFKNAHEQLAKL